MFLLIFACSAQYSSSTYAPTIRRASTGYWTSHEKEEYMALPKDEEYQTFASLTSNFEEATEEFTENYDYYIQPKEYVTLPPDPAIPTATEEAPYTMYEL